MSLKGLISSDSFGKNCAKYITQPMNDLIHLLVRGIGSLYTRSQRSESMNFVDCQKHAIFFQHKHKAFENFLMGFDVRCKNNYVIHYAVSVFTNLRW